MAPGIILTRKQKLSKNNSSHLIDKKIILNVLIYVIERDKNIRRILMKKGYYVAGVMFLQFLWALC